MIDSIQHQLDAVRALLSDAGEGAAAGGGGHKTSPAVSTGDYLSDKEEDELGKLMTFTAEEKTALLAEFTARVAASQNAEGPKDGTVSDKG